MPLMYSCAAPRAGSAAGAQRHVRAAAGRHDRCAQQAGAVGHLTASGVVSYRLADWETSALHPVLDAWHKAGTMFLLFCLPALLAGQRHLRTAVLDRSYLQAVDLQEARKRYRCAATLTACAVRRLHRMAAVRWPRVGCCCYTVHSCWGWLIRLDAAQLCPCLPSRTLLVPVQAAG